MVPGSVQKAGARMRRQRQGPAAWTLARVHTLIERLYVVAFFLLVFVPRSVTLIRIPGYAFLALYPLFYVVVIARGELRLVDSDAFELGQRLGRPRVVAGAELWAGIVFAIFMTWNVVTLLAPGIADPMGIAEPIFGLPADVASFLLVVLVALAPMLLLYLIDFGWHVYRA